VKKLRYDTELLVSALGRPADRMVAALQPLQETLGELHDADVGLAWLEELVASSPRRLRASAPPSSPSAPRWRSAANGSPNRSASAWSAGAGAT